MEDNILNNFFISLPSSGTVNITDEDINNLVTVYGAEIGTNATVMIPLEPMMYIKLFFKLIKNSNLMKIHDKQYILKMGNLEYPFKDYALAKKALPEFEDILFTNLTK